MADITKKYTTGNRRYKSAEKYTPQGIVLHSIGCPQPNASVLWNSWQNDNSAYVTHYVLDDKQILQCMPDNYKCWHICNPGNSKWIGVEMCEPKQIKYTSGAKFTCTNLSAAQDYVRKTYANAVQLFATICKKYGWNPQTAIYTHNYVTVNKLSNTNHVDPEHLWNGLGLSYTLAGFRNDVAKAMGSTTKVEVKEEKPTSNTYEPKLVKITATALNVRKGAGTNYKVVTVVPKNMVYTIVDEQDGWGLLKSYQKKRDGWICLKYTQWV